MKNISAKNNSFIDNKKAISHPIEFVTAFGIIMIVFPLVFSSISNMFSMYEKDDFLLRAKAMIISERLIKDAGKTTDGKSEWEFHINNLLCLGLASYLVLNDTWNITWPSYQSPPTPDYIDKTTHIYYNSSLLGAIEDLEITTYRYIIAEYPYPIRVKKVISNKINYGVLDSDKIDAMNRLNYSKAKKAIGLEEKYDFNIIIKDKNGKELLEYGKPYGKEKLVGSYTRNVRVYLAYNTRYIDAQLTVRVF